MIQKTLLGLLTIAVLGLGYLQLSKSSSDAYVNLNDVYQQFKYQKDLNRELETYVLSRQSELDSLDHAFEAFYLANQSEKETLALKHQELRKYKAEVHQVMNDFELNTENKIWALINKAVNTYGLNKELDFIYGASGSGTLMYANNKYNITSEIVDHLNHQTYD